MFQNDNYISCCTNASVAHGAGSPPQQEEQSRWSLKCSRFSLVLDAETAGVKVAGSSLIECSLELADDTRGVVVLPCPNTEEPTVLGGGESSFETHLGGEERRHGLMKTHTKAGFATALCKVGSAEEVAHCEGPTVSNEKMAAGGRMVTNGGTDFATALGKVGSVENATGWEANTMASVELAEKCGKGDLRVEDLDIESKLLPARDDDTDINRGVVVVGKLTEGHMCGIQVEHVEMSRIVVKISHNLDAQGAEQASEWDCEIAVTSVCDAASGKENTVAQSLTSNAAVLSMLPEPDEQGQKRGHQYQESLGAGSQHHEMNGALDPLIDGTLIVWEKEIKEPDKFEFHDPQKGRMSSEDEQANRDPMVPLIDGTLVEWARRVKEPDRRKERSGHDAVETRMSSEEDEPAGDPQVPLIDGTLVEWKRRVREPDKKGSDMDAAITMVQCMADVLVQECEPLINGTLIEWEREMKEPDKEYCRGPSYLCLLAVAGLSVQQDEPLIDGTLVVWERAKKEPDKAYAGRAPARVQK